MSEPIMIPFPEWNGEDAQHLTVAPDGAVYVIPSGAHERLHRILIGERDVAEGFDRLRGTKVELALVGWVQLQSDKLTDRINIDAPDGFSDEGIVRRFVRMHDAGSVVIARYPSGDVQTSNTPEQIVLSVVGERVPIALEQDEREKEDDCSLWDG